MRVPKALRLLVAGVLFGLPLNQAVAAPIVFSGYDPGATSLAAAPLATGAAADFDAAAPNLSLITFETGIPPGVTVSPGNVTNDSVCGAQFCGYNTTPGGEFFYLAEGGLNTFTFSTPIDSFGAFFTGWQVGSQTLTYVDNTTVTLPMPDGIPSQGGTLFFGFQDAGAQIVSVTYDALVDIVSVDDVRFGNLEPTTVPEPSALALFVIALGGLGFMARRRSR